MGMVSPAYYSAEMVRALPNDGRRYETVHGELLVTPAPSAWHQEIIVRLCTALRDYLSREMWGHVFASPADISWGPDILVQPDLFVVPLEEARTLDWAKMERLLLTVEVLSPSTERHDRFTKRRLYQEVGIPSYWIVDPNERLVEIWKPSDKKPTIERQTIEWMPPGAEKAFSIELGQLFRAI